MITMISNSLFSQDFTEIDSMSQSARQQGQYSIENLDRLKFTTDYLFNIGAPLIDFEAFNGLRDSVMPQANPKAFVLSFASIMSMCIDTNLALHPDDISSNASGPTDLGNVPIGILHFSYDQIKDYALDSSLLTMVDNQLFDVLEVEESPYLVKDLFLATPLKSAQHSLSFNYVLDTSLFYHNQTAEIDSITIDVADGNGIQLVTFGQNIPVIYGEPGIKIIEITIYYDDSTEFVCQSKIGVFPPSNSLYPLSADMMWETTAVEPYLDTLGKADISVYFACGHDKLIKPLIWVEGFNPIPLLEFDPGQNLDPFYMLGILNDEKSLIDGKRMREQFDWEGYDLVYVDFHNGGDYVQRSARVVEQVIREVNTLKATNNSDESNVLIGESLGGLIGRYALLEMEAADEDHETGTYISFDSPHQGANIPIAGQYAALHLPYIRFGGSDLWEYFAALALLEDIVDLVDIEAEMLEDFLETAPIVDIRLGEQMLRTPAAQQMLIYQVPDDFSNVDAENLTNPLHSSFMTEYHALGNLEHCEELMSSNGSGLGTSGSQGFAPNESLFKIDGNFFTLLGSAFMGTTVGWESWALSSALAVQADLRALPDYSASNQLIYHFKLRNNVGPMYFVWTNKTVKVKKVYPLDGAPGGYYDIDLPTNPVIDEFIGSGVLEINFNTFNYIPTYSGLNLSSSYLETPFEDLSNLGDVDYESPAFRTSNVIDLYEGSDIFGVTASYPNANHIHLYERNSEWLYFHLIGHNGINQNTNLSSNSFNFGVAQFGSSDNFENTNHRKTVSRIDVLDNITGTAQVYINKNNRIGFIGGDEGSYTVLGTASEPTHFAVFVKPTCLDEDKELNVYSGGLLYIGEGEYQTGDLHLLSGVTLTVGDGGSLYIRENSRIIVHEGARLIFEDGATVVNYGSIKLLGDPSSSTYTENGILEYNDGVELIMPKTVSNIHFNGGDMRINENATFEIMHDGYGESGELRFSKYGESIVGSSGAQIYLTGKNDADVMIRIDEDADFWTNDDFHFIKLKDSKVLIDDNGRFVSIPVFYADDCNFVGVEGNRGISVFQTSTITNSNMDLVTVNAPLFYINNGILKIFNSTFENNSNDYDVYVSGRGFNIQNVEFNSDASTMISSNNMTLTSKVSSSTFNGNISSSYASSGIQDFSPSEVRISGSTFNENYYCAEKSYGQLSLKCNSFLDFQFSGVSASNDCRLAMTSGTNLGYNLFDKVSPSLGHNIILNNAANLEVFNGSNIFDESGTLSIFHGTLQVGLPGIGTMMLGTNNRWSLTSPTYVPSSSEFTLSSSIGGGAVGVYIPSLEAASCGYYDGTVDYPEANGEFNSVQRITTQEFDNQKMANAIKFAILNTELYDPTKNDLYALKLFGEILTYNYQDTTAVVAREWLKYYAYTIMKQTLQHAFFTDTVRVADNQSSFDQHVTRYVNVLNTLSSETVNTSNYLKQFNIEMDKAHLFHALGKDSIALDILVNMELCGVDSMEQVTINYWKYQYEMEQAMKSYGIEGFFLDTNWVDTSGYIVPSNRSFGDFSSTIESPNSVTFVNCSQNLAPLTDGSTGRFDLYPNPSEGVFTVSCIVPEESTGLLEIYNILGELVATFDCGSGTHTKTIDVSDVRKGVYIYRFSIDQQVEYSGKVVIQ